MSTEESPSGCRDSEGLNGDDHHQLRQRKGKLINCAKDTITNGMFFRV